MIGLVRWRSQEWVLAGVTRLKDTFLDGKTDLAGRERRSRLGIWWMANRTMPW
jgi:hypothetical protein